MQSRMVISPRFNQARITESQEVCFNGYKQETRRIKIPCCCEGPQPSLRVPTQPLFLPSSGCWWSFAADGELLPSQIFSATPSHPVHNTGGWMTEQVSEKRLTLRPRSEFQTLDSKSGWGFSTSLAVGSFCIAPKWESTGNPTKTGLRQDLYLAQNFIVGRTY